MVLAIIPARSGSKSVSDKNLKPILGRPMLAYSIDHALAAAKVDRVIVDTDSERYAKIARGLGAETPFLRPPEFAQDRTPDLEVFKHALAWLKQHETVTPDLVVHLRPTYPFREEGAVDQAIAILEDHAEWDSVRSVAPAPHTPYKMWQISPDQTLRPLLDLSEIDEPYNQPRQSLPLVYHQNACIDVIRASTILDQNSMTGSKIGGFLMSHFLDVDSRDDLEKVEHFLASGSAPMGKTFVIGIDELLEKSSHCSQFTDKEWVALINQIVKMENKVTLSTSQDPLNRLSVEATLKRLGVMYHHLYFGAAEGDYYIDSKSIPLSVAEKWLLKNEK